MQPRAFNTIDINYKEGHFTKSSHNIPKLKDEIYYYLSMPKKIAAFFPRMIDFKKDFSAYTMEYIPYHNLSELILSHQISFHIGKKILLKLMNMLNHLHCFKLQINANHHDIQNFYINKTIERVNQLRQYKNLCSLVNSPEILINGQSYRSFDTLKKQFIDTIKLNINQNTEITFIHGDFCFSNVLFNPQTHDIKLIDPRGSFGAAGVYGHADYDYAKILHCLHGRYDCLVKGLYKLEETAPNHFIFNRSEFKLLDKFYQFYNVLLLKKGINVKFLYLIEASLFLSMSALHYEDERRQKALYLTGLMMLNHFFENKYENMY